MSIDHVHTCIEIPFKHAISSVLGLSAIAIARTVQGKDKNYNGVHFWIMGYVVNTVGFDEEIIKNYIREQNDNDGKF